MMAENRNMDDLASRMDGLASRKDRLVATTGEKLGRKYENYALRFRRTMWGLRSAGNNAEALDNMPHQRLAESEARNALIDEMRQKILHAEDLLAVYDLLNDWISQNESGGIRSNSGQRVVINELTFPNLWGHESFSLSAMAGYAKNILSGASIENYDQVPKPIKRLVMQDFASSPDPLSSSLRNLLSPESYEDDHLRELAQKVMAHISLDQDGRINPDQDLSKLPREWPEYFAAWDELSKIPGIAFLYKDDRGHLTRDLMPILCFVVAQVSNYLDKQEYGKAEEYLNDLRSQGKLSPIIDQALTHYLK